MPRPSRLTPEQEFDAYQRAKGGQPYAEIGALFGVHKSSITRLVQRVEARAVAADAQPPAQDPKTGVEVEVTDELLLSQVIRDLSAIYHRNVGDVETKISIAHVLPKLTTARHRIRHPSPAPGPRPPAPRPTEPERPEQPEELVRFN
jgi:hypothetical protein